MRLYEEDLGEIEMVNLEGLESKVIDFDSHN